LCMKRSDGEGLSISLWTNSLYLTLEVGRDANLDCR